MKVEEKRIFISDLPETATQTDIENSFRSYGNVISVEIKERKELGPRNNSLFFAYVNIEIDDKNLQQCFKYFSTEKWHGCYVILQIARESFLDRLKRERQENDGKAKNDNTLEKSLEMPQQILRRHISNGIKEVITKKYESSESESSDENSLKREDKKEHRTPNFKTKGMELKSSISLGSTKIEKPIDINETVDIIIKNNKGKVLDKNGLKIASVGNKPIIKIDRSKKKEVLNSSEANLKRLQSISNLKKGYQTQKSLIQAALSKIDSNSKSKIVFDKNIVNASVKKSHQVEKQSRISLFDDEVNEEEEFVTNFNIKEQFQGQEGQKLLELQSKYKNDKRFVLDARFLDKRETGGGKNANDVEGEEISLEEEKKKEYEILEQVLGKKINPKSLHQKEAQSRKKVMLRYDPTQPEHSKYEIKKELGKQKKRKRNESEIEIFNEEKQDEKEVPIVSKEIFYKVRDNLKESLDEKQEFSLLSIFGKKDERGRKLAINVLPTYGDMMRCYLWYSQSQINKNKNKPLKDLVSNTSDIVALEVERIWKKASIPIVEHRVVVKRIREYKEKYRQLLKPYKKEYKKKILEETYLHHHSEAGPSKSRMSKSPIPVILQSISTLEEPSVCCENKRGSRQFPVVARTLDRYGISDRAGAAIVSATLQDMGLINEEDYSKVVDRNMIRRVRAKKRSDLSKTPQSFDCENFGEQNTDYSSKQLQDNMNGILVGKNPFRYDSSDEEETEKISKKDLQLVKKTLEPVQTKVNRSHFWTEPFFFKTMIIDCKRDLTLWKR
ncbi:hypothetical protein NQ314_000227 [Rhamnusium bicolor]|uniref:RRM domain-containing protein n=1 Tax=Rhamnusium bicolor TaxID=1586634 RepID=A0AAV8ZXC1_9CUCU|nr:hypothetical protein NQ314_000227 [Rhamnusium bicolor]